MMHRTKGLFNKKKKREEKTKAKKDNDQRGEQHMLFSKGRKVDSRNK